MNDGMNLNLNKEGNNNLYLEQNQPIVGYDAQGNPIYGYPIQPQGQPLGYNTNGGYPAYGQPQMQQQPTFNTAPQYEQQPLGDNPFVGAMTVNANVSQQNQALSNVNNQQNLEEVKEHINAHKLALRNSPEVLSLLSEIDISDGSSIANFGQKSSVEISKVSEELLSKVKSLDDVGVADILKDLNSIMKDFDIDKLNKEPSLLAKLFGGNPIDKIFAKYETMSEKVDKIALTLASYETVITQDVRGLQKLREANIIYYNELEKHIVAGEVACEKIKEAWEEAKRVAEQTNYAQDMETATRYKMAYDMMEKRTLDLKTAEAIALGANPVINQLTMGYFNLMTTLKGTLIVSLPAFKTALCEAVSARKTQNIKDNIDAVNNTVADLITKYSKKTAETNVELIKNTSQGVIPADKLQEYVNNILNGAKEVEKAQLEVSANRQNTSRQLDDIKAKLIASNISQNSIQAPNQTQQIQENNFKLK